MTVFNNTLTSLLAEGMKAQAVSQVQGAPAGLPGAPPQGLPGGPPQGLPEGLPGGPPQGLPEGLPQELPEGPPQGALEIGKLAEGEEIGQEVHAELDRLDEALGINSREQAAEINAQAVQFPEEGPAPAESSAKPPFKIPSGYMLADQNDPMKGLKPIPGGPADKALSGETAGKKAMMETAKAFIPKIEKKIFNPDGSINRKNLAASDIPLVPGSDPVPYTEGAELHQSYELGIQAITRAETGAAMPESEVANTRKRFQPNIWDSDDVVRQKVLSYKMFINGYLDLISKDKQGKVHFDDNKAQTMKAKMQIELDNYKDDWVERAREANPGIDPEILNREWNKKLMTDESFIKKLGKKLKGAK